jgi:Asp/Glu/hydantoin racemase
MVRESPVSDYSRALTPTIALLPMPTVDAILFTCSAFGSSIEKVKVKHTDLPVRKPNEAMMDRAVDIGGNVGVLSVFEPTVPSIVRELEDIARASDKTDGLSVHAQFVPDALAVLRGGDEDQFNEMVADAAAAMVSEQKVGCVVLAMFSMACAGPAVQARLGSSVQVLTSPEAAVEQLKSVLE